MIQTKDCSLFIPLNVQGCSTHNPSHDALTTLTQMKTIDKVYCHLTSLLTFAFIIMIPQRQPLGHSACSCRFDQPSGKTEVTTIMFTSNFQLKI